MYVRLAMATKRKTLSNHAGAAGTSLQPNEQMVFLPSSIVPSSPGFLSFMWFTLFPNMPGVHYPRSPTFPSSPVGGSSQNRRRQRAGSVGPVVLCNVASVKG